ncbi:MAG: CPBP family intramembrane metalloprotease domain-containing protein [Leptolyngbya sp.]|nr:MAG: CPBP family intramembrane metalloprotease domain-containing protein [Leptolyngbya sp.]
MSAIAAAVLFHISSGITIESNYAITSRAPFNQPAFYPIPQTLPADLYRPVAPWLGRLILPKPQQQGGTDWVWMEITHAPPNATDLIGKQVRLEWSQKPSVQRDVIAGIRDVKFSPLVAKLRLTKADLYADRLNGRSRVGSLQAIAGARPQDDVTVSLAAATLIQQPNGSPALQIEREPLLDTGRSVTLVKILGAVASPPKFIPSACPGEPPCPSELFRVQHYNPATQQFDGVQSTVRIPQQPIDGNGVYASTPRELEKSPAGVAGWYLYGAQDQTGLFTVQAIKPRSLFQLNPQQVLLETGKGLDYINHQNWRDTEQHKGTIQTVLIDPKAKTTEAAIAQWQAGDRALVMHLFGGRGGRSGEGSVGGTVTGHFAYGMAEVIRDPFTNELQLDVRYQQVYANNIEGVISGENSWTNYMGNLQRGWLGTRPVTDVLVKLDTIGQDYDFGGIKLSPFTELTRQLRIIGDRYRTGDGTGIASVTAATSCVQDSNQALFATIQSIRNQVVSSSEIQRWWSSHPHDPTIKRFERLIALGNDLQRELIPFGIVRQDWKSNAALSGTQIEPQEFVRAGAGVENILTALTSWRTILPRQAQDELSIQFLRHGAKLWFLRTNQIGGNNPDILPIAPTQVFGKWTVPGTNIAIGTILFNRILGAVNLPTLENWSVALGALLIYGAIALPIGLSQRFLQFKPWYVSSWHYLLLAVRLFFMPALIEEFIFRVLLLPYPRAGITGQMWFLWAVFSLIMFIAYHPLNAKTLYKPGNPTFFDPIFLTLAGFLGIACTITYFLTSSLLLITLLHWIVTTTWLTLLGGMEKLHPHPAKGYG